MTSPCATGSSMRRNSSPPSAKIFYAQEMILAGAKEIEVTNLGNPEGIPQFRDAEQVLTALQKRRLQEALRKSRESITMRLS